MDGPVRLKHWQSVCLIWMATPSVSPGLAFHCTPSTHFTSLSVGSALVLSLSAFDILIHGHSPGWNNKTMWGVSAKT